MNQKDLPYTDFTHLSESIINCVRTYHNANDFLDFSEMPEKEIDNYIEVWFAHLPADALQEFYDDAMCDNTLVKDTILQLYGFPKAKADTEKALIREKFLRPSNNLKEPQSWATRVQECVNCVLENEQRKAA